MKEPSIFKPWRVSYDFLGRSDNLPEYFCFFSASAWELVLADIPENFPTVVDWFGVFLSLLLCIFGKAVVLILEFRIQSFKASNI
jgi:hypothetical protein